MDKVSIELTVLFDGQFWMGMFESTSENKLCVCLSLIHICKEQLVNRMMCAEALVDAQKVRTGDLNADDWSKLVDAMGVLSEAPIYIDDTPGITAMDIRAKCRRLKLEKGLGLVVIDYLQLMSGNGRTDSRDVYKRQNRG